MNDTSKKPKNKKKYKKKQFRNTEITIGGEKFMIPPVVKLAGAWFVFVLVLVLFISTVKKQNGKTPNKDTAVNQTGQEAQSGQPATDEAGQPVTDSSGNQASSEQITTPMEVSADPDLNQFVADYLTALTACNADQLKTMVTDPTVYDDMSGLQARAQYIQSYINLKCYTKAGPTENTIVVFVVTNTTLANIATAPMDFMTLYIEKNGNGYVINNYTQSDDVKAYIETLKQDSDIQAVMRDIETYNSMAIENDAGLKAFYQMLGQ